MTDMILFVCRNRMCVCVCVVIVLAIFLFFFFVFECIIKQDTELWFYPFCIYYIFRLY